MPDLEISSVRARLFADSPIRVAPPYKTTFPSGKAVVIPWYVHIGERSELSVTCDRAALVALRDALSAALDAHPDDSPVGEGETS